jgi:hypothetical protein
MLLPLLRRSSAALLRVLALNASIGAPEVAACGGKAWDVETDPVVLPIAAAEGELHPAIPAYMMVCRNCGFVRLHSTEALLGD